MALPSTLPSTLPPSLSSSLPPLSISPCRAANLSARTSLSQS